MLFLFMCLIALAYSMVVLPMLWSFGKSCKSLGNPSLFSYHLISLANVQRNELTISTLDRTSRRGYHLSLIIEPIDEAEESCPL